MNDCLMLGRVAGHCFVDDMQGAINGKTNQGAGGLIIKH